MKFRVVASYALGLPLIAYGLWKLKEWIVAIIDSVTNPSEFEFYLFLAVALYPLLIGILFLANSHRFFVENGDAHAGKGNMNFLILLANAIFFLFFWILRTV